MPAKKQISKQKIFDTAFEIVRAEGLKALNMRTLADKCGCSTQPIYLSFSGAEELKKQVIERAIKTYQSYIENEIASGKYSEYKAIGMGYIRFAKEQKQLFKILLMNEGANEDELGDYDFQKSTAVIMKNYGLYKEDSVKLHAEMWIFVHGIATMFATEYLDWDWETVSKMVSDVFLGLTDRLKGDNK